MSSVRTETPRRMSFGAVTGVGLICAFVATSHDGLAAQKLEGRVIGTTLTQCDFKPRTCEGTLDVQTKIAGKTQRVTILVRKGTTIKKGNAYILLPALNGGLVAIAYVTEKGNKLAQSIEVKP